MNHPAKAQYVLVVDDHELVCGGVRHLLSSLSIAARVDAVGTIREARKQLREELPDLVFLDVKLPDGNGCQLLQEIKQRAPGVPVVMISGQMTPLLARELMERGADGLCDKGDSTSCLGQALDAALSGEFYASESVRCLLDSDPGNVSLSPRQREMLHCLAEGKTNKEIAYKLGLSQATISFHFSELRRKLGCKNTREVLTLAGDLGLIGEIAVSGSPSSS